MTENDTYVLVLGTADWNQPIATNQHYAVRELCAGSPARIAFLESLGLRRPEFSRRDLSRMLARVARLRGTRDGGDNLRRPLPAGLEVVSPLVIPHHRGPAQQFNRRALTRQVAAWLTWRGRKVLWTYTPVTYGLDQQADHVVYHCVDLLAQVPGIDSRLIERGEMRLASRGYAAAASSPVVKDHLVDIGFTDVSLWENVADTATVLESEPQSSQRVPGRVVFAGNLTRNKVDFAILQDLARMGLDVRVAGPFAEGGGKESDAYRALLGSGVKHLGMLSPRALAEELSTAAVGLIPYRSNDYTRGVSPLKTFEYLAAGLAVVSIGVPSVRAIPGHVDVVETRTDFLERVKLHSAAPTTAQIIARGRIADAHSWGRRGIQVRRAAGLSGAADVVG
ncbi:glycosyltransferase family 1 protein [Georgenia halophila]|uniref:Glycosyltransferase family 1 protein n=1 Tax=Georgenia halophila TaxID=620889 RepID=A0ABP8KTM5_9MICO